MAELQNQRQRRDGVEVEEDYMGDLSLFLPPDDLSSSSTSKKMLKPQPTSTKKPKILSWQEQRKLQRDRRQLDEDERTRAGLEAAIPSSNIGFKMLQMMGYNPGSALGKDPFGRTEPVGLDIRRSRAGIGRETPGEERSRKVRESEERKRRRDGEVEEAAEDFGAWQRIQFRSRRVVSDYHKAEATLARLEHRDEEEPEVKKDGEEGQEEEEEEEEVITEEDLRSILLRLRGEHRYCLYCGFQYESAEELESNCPGLEDDAH